MKINKLLIAAVLAIAIGAPIAGFCRGEEWATTNDVTEYPRAVPPRTIPSPKLPVSLRSPLSSAPTNGSIRRR